MRFTLTLVFTALTHFLIAQQLLPLGEGWQLSVAFEPSRERYRDLNVSVTSQDTFPFQRPTFTLPGFRRPRFEAAFGPDTVTYYSEPEFGSRFRRLDPLFELLTSVSVHYRTAVNIEVSAGFFFSRSRDNNDVEFPTGLPDDFSYNRGVNRHTYGGVSASARYNFFPRSRLQPYYGLRTLYGLRHFEQLEAENVFPGRGLSQSALVAARFRRNTIFDLNLHFIAGITYRISKRLAISGAVRMESLVIPYSGSLQLRSLFVESADSAATD